MYHYYVSSTITDICFRARVTQPDIALVHFCPSSSNPQCGSSLRAKPGSYTKQLAIINKRTVVLSAVLLFHSAVSASGHSLQVGMNTLSYCSVHRLQTNSPAGDIFRQKQGCPHPLREITWRSPLCFAGVGVATGSSGCLGFPKSPPRAQFRHTGRAFWLCMRPLACPGRDWRPGRQNFMQLGGLLCS